MEAKRIPQQTPSTTLPAWIEPSAAWGELSAGCRRTLQAVARRCDYQPLPCGSLIPCVGGRRLAEEAGITHRTLRRHVAELERQGFLACIGRIGCGTNVYGIPGSLGALKQQSILRRRIHQVWTADGRHVPQDTAPGEQMTFLSLADLTTHWRHAPQSRAPHIDEAFVPPRVLGGRTECPRGVGQNILGGRTKCPTIDHYPDHSRDPVKTPMGNGVCAEGATEKSGPRTAKAAGVGGAARGLGLPRVTADHFREPGKMVGLYEEAIRRGLAEASEAGRVRWFAYAAYAQRVAREPERLFAHLVNRGHALPGRTLCYVSGADEEAGQRLWRAWCLAGGREASNGTDRAGL